MSSPLTRLRDLEFYLTQRRLRDLEFYLTPYEPPADHFIPTRALRDLDLAWASLYTRGQDPDTSPGACRVAFLGSLLLVSAFALSPAWCLLICS